MNPDEAAAGARVAPFAAALSLGVTLAVGFFALLLAAAVALWGDTQAVEWTLFLLGFLVFVPIGAVVGQRLADRLWRRLGAGGGWVLAAGLAGGLGAAVLIARIASPELGWSATATLAVAVGAGGTGGAVLIGLCMRGGNRSLGVSPVVAVSGGVVAAAAAALAVTHAASVAGVALAALAAAVALIAVRLRPRPLGPRAGAAFDVAICALFALAIPDLVYLDEIPGYTFLTSHEHFYLGPVNDILGGRAVLVDTSSQYGVGPLYLLAAWFELAPIGYGTLTLFGAGLVVLQTIGAYALLRIAGCGRLLAAAALAVAVVATVWGTQGAPGHFPNIGPLRFAPPLALVLAMVAATRRPRSSRWLHGVALATLGLASVWSIETFLYTAVTAAALVVFEAAVAAQGVRTFVRRLVAPALWGLAACVVAHASFFAVTLAASGEAPDWGIYLAYFGEFAVGSYSDLGIFLFEPWTPGLGVGVAYAVSATAVLLLMLRRRDVVARHLPLLVAIVGVNAWGAASFTYFVGRSATFVLVYLSLPAILLGALWLQLLLEEQEGAAGVRAGAVAVAVWLAGLSVAAAWEPAADRLPGTALGHLVPGADRSLAEDAQRMWESPPLSARAGDAEALLAERFPGTGPALVLIEPDLTTEVLMRSGRINRLPIGHPRQEDLIRPDWLPEVYEEVDALEPGTVMLTQRSVLEAPPVTGPLDAPSEAYTGAAQEYRSPVALQLLALDRIRDRFRLEVVERAPGGLLVVRLLTKT